MPASHTVGRPAQVAINERVVLWGLAHRVLSDHVEAVHYRAGRETRTSSSACSGLDFDALSQSAV